MNKLGLTAATLVATCSLITGAIAQGSQRLIGLGCPTKLKLLSVRGTLGIGTKLQIDTSLPTNTPTGFGHLAFGLPLPQSQWTSFLLNDAAAGPRLCSLVIAPILTVEVTNNKPSLTMVIPSDPTLIGVPIGVQLFGRFCGFAGCTESLSEGIEITIG